MSKLVWLITGCSSGFGAQFVHHIISRGDHVIATGRNLEKLAHLSSTGASLVQLDITSPQEDVDKVVNQAIAVHGKIDVLVSNAAFVSIGTWEDLT
jgi:NAD(P)-dependent dehydrogenase (short-subunit alcohol dehydrogenase family)